VTTIIDLRITYKRGAPIAYLRPLTIQGRNWVWDNLKAARYVGSNAIVDAEALLPLIERMTADKLVLHWQE
jgi:hypothetical protein